MAQEIEFKTQIAKYRRINISKSLYQIEDGDKVIVIIKKLEEDE